ncbi:MAG: DUF4435 domain-containing protein [Bacteroidetes bacterium]|nr:MAG: DUF4435 domain-containing protein [Bacteroidota bacterium]
MSNLLDNIGEGLEQENVVHNSKRVTVFVENEDDIPFWKDIFTKFGIATSITPPIPNEKDEKGLKRGKENVLRFAEQTNKAFVLCVDSDYDYLTNNKTKKSRLINENPFIFQTYTYAIENYKCFSETLDLVLVEACLVDEQVQVFDFELFMKKYSQTIYELFLYSFFYDLENRLKEELYDVAYQSAKKELSEEKLIIWEKENTFTHIFSIKEFCKKIHILEQVNTFQKALEELERIKNEADHCLNSLPKIETAELNNLKNELALLGVLPENVYLFVRGHDVYKNVVCMFLNPLFDFLKNKKLQEISKSGQTPEEIEIKRNEYAKLVFTTEKDKMSAVERVLYSHKYYHRCFLMRKIEADVQVFMTHLS